MPLAALIRGPLARPRPAPLARLLAMLAAARSHRQLGRLDDRLLRDVGLTRADARRDTGLPPWNAPGHWLR
ncbi:DUF1127 domain-containing protein [Rubellimicrobium aerolatum]|uniref:DUF1127 domain-containing protein n=1 Tax=Rubellimicrobium aerolatum TaxID=490979 RepID=A0ABW0SC56_9RHOB|nr:DUF1127 domain-containing protein [Rubellimicrobium aerolatum]MBP1806240.1 uncharacterized protein YjiS (DUF1127 family) [Rubellimicrobium aerolatum]